MSKNKTRADDDKALEAAPDKVTAKHGGKVVETVSKDELVSFNDSECKHVTLIRDPSETEFNAFMCSNPNCAVVVIYEKT